MDLEIISASIFFLIIIIYLLKNRKEVEFHYGIIIRRWKGGEKRIDKIVKGKREILRKIGNFFVAAGILISLAGIFFLIYYTLQFKQVFGLAAPSFAGVKYPGPVISIPFWYWLIAVFVVIASHETMHAIFTRVENIKLKSYGIIFLLFFPIGAFVDPEKKVFEKLRGIKKMRICAVGSFGNILVFAIAFLLFFASNQIVDLLMENAGIKFEVLPDTPAEKVGMEGIMIKIDNQTIGNRIDLSNFLKKTRPGENVTIFTTKGKYEITLAEHPEEKNRGFIGISNIKEVYRFKMLFTGYVPDALINSLSVWYNILFWLSILNLGVGAANLLPIKPLDGGYLFEEIFIKFFGKRGKKIANALSLIILLFLIFNIFAISAIRKI
jgi:membrane-associated protease RseP (regulator of RpoE activity)